MRRRLDPKRFRFAYGTIRSPPTCPQTSVLEERMKTSTCMLRLGIGRRPSLRTSRIRFDAHPHFRIFTWRVPANVAIEAHSSLSHNSAETPKQTLLPEEHNQHVIV